MAGEPWVVEAGGIPVEITHPHRIIFPDAGITKRDIVEYYLRVADRILPGVIGRPMVLHRYPAGVGAPGFYQKRAPDKHPDWVMLARLPSPTTSGPIDYVVCDNLATVLWMANLGAFEMNPWLSRAADPGRPTHLVVDLDPMGGGFADVCRAALLARSPLVERGFEPAVKTSGKSGVHITAPLRESRTFQEVRNLLLDIGRELDSRHPEVFAVEERIKQRDGQIYFDYNQNGYGSTLAAAWSLRPTAQATISMPLAWDDLEHPLDPSQFNIHTIPDP